MSDKFANNKFSVMAGGKEIVCDILFTHHSEQTGKDYMAFTDHSKAPDGSANLATFAFVCVIVFVLSGNWGLYSSQIIQFSKARLVRKDHDGETKW